ncbi:hypothetical protein FQN55_001030 [Onygenales sp. PD_40]|nr:hypothetical protein FQN55_001030 [Onygenales sp. PD_40]KAK2792151.1 hypothetical protein FQN52_003919 [Onygenales sp. PD_12]KAK2798260.1 hypothetical protein FQN51_007826 [Onygenales sp. PD_10]
MASKREKRPRFTASLQTRLLFIIALSVSFILAELVVGFSTHSVAVIADAFHYTGDVLSFVVAYMADKLSNGPPPVEPKSTGDVETSTGSSSNTLPALEAQQSVDKQNGRQGYHILPDLAAFFNSVFLLALGLGIFLQAIERFVNLEKVNDPKLVMIMGCTGLFLNILSALVLKGHGHSHAHGHDHAHTHSHPHPPALDTTPPSSPQSQEPHDNGHSHNHPDTSLSIKAVLLHISADALNNLAVIISAVVMWKVPPHHEPQEHSKLPAKFYADPICTMFISVLIMLGSAPLTVKAGRALMGHAGDGRRGEYSVVEKGCRDDEGGKLVDSSEGRTGQCLRQTDEVVVGEEGK